MSIDYPFLSLNEPATEIAIQVWEQATLISIPEQYKHFLLQSNGAGNYPGWGFSYPDPETGQLITDSVLHFLSLEDIKGTALQLSVHKERTGQSYHLEELIPVATNYCHSCTTMIGYRGEDFGKIIMLDYIGFEDENGDLKKIYLADSFDDFLNMFFKLPE